MLKLATILDNPGEPHAQTQYRDPAHLKALGYNGLVIYETTGLSGVDHLDRLGSGEMRRWVGQQVDELRGRIDEAHGAGLDVYICYDALSLAAATAEQHREQATCKGNADTVCPASDTAMNLCTAALRGLLAMLPTVEGVVLRVGDNDAVRLPYLIGNDVYLPHCARCGHLGRADRVERLLHRYHDLVVGEMSLRLIARAWNLRPGGMHDSVDLAQRIAERLPGDPDDDRLILSFKFTETDFWRYQRWNQASLQFARRSILYELQCQREFEGKGGIPNWQVPLWRDGGEEVEETFGLAEAAGRVNLAGLWAWVRGGGWGGPFVKNETWIDANVFAVPQLADDPQIQPGALADRWIRDRLSIDDAEVAAVLREILEQSPAFAAEAFYIGPYAVGRGTPWHPNADWLQDDLLDTEAAWRIVQRMPAEALDQLVREKRSAVERINRSRAALRQLVNDDNHATISPLVDTLTYAESLAEALCDLLWGMVEHRRWQKSKDAAHAEQCRTRLRSAQDHWNQHTQRHGSLPGAATAFREARLWDLTERLLAQVESS